jgi:hypothetical protein
MGAKEVGIACLLTKKSLILVLLVSRRAHPVAYYTRGIGNEVIDGLYIVLLTYIGDLRLFSMLQGAQLDR